MMPYSFQEYNLLSYENNIKSNWYKVFVVGFLIGVILLLYNFKFSIYNKGILYKEKYDYYLLLELDKDISDNSKLVISNKEYEYVLNLRDINYTNDNGKIYKSIPIYIEGYDSDDKYVSVNYLYKNKTLINTIFDFITGG